MPTPPPPLYPSEPYPNSNSNPNSDSNPDPVEEKPVSPAAGVLPTGKISLFTLSAPSSKSGSHAHVSGPQDPSPSSKSQVQTQTQTQMDANTNTTTNNNAYAYGYGYAPSRLSQPALTLNDYDYEDDGYSESESGDDYAPTSNTTAGSNSIYPSSYSEKHSPSQPNASKLDNSSSPSPSSSTTPRTPRTHTTTPRTPTTTPTLLPHWRSTLLHHLLPHIERESLIIARMQRAIRTPWLDAYFVYTSSLGTHSFFMTVLPALFFFGWDDLGRG